MKRIRPPTYRPHSLLTFAQAGEVLGLSRWTIRDMADDGRLTTYTIPGDPRRIRRIRHDELLAVKRQIEASATTVSRRGEAA
jgi:excisionase family DNA binding protein